jgi:2-keto-3-deoxy-6-phosphogluconate aldolase
MQIYSAEIIQKEPRLVPKTRFYYITTISQKNSRNFCQIAEFCGGIGGKTSPRPGISTHQAQFQSERRKEH